MHECHNIVVLQQMLMWYGVKDFRNVQKETVSTFAVVYNVKENGESQYWQVNNLIAASIWFNN